MLNLLLPFALIISSHSTLPPNTMIVAQDNHLQNLTEQSQLAEDRATREEIREKVTQLLGIQMREDFDPFFDGKSANYYSHEYCKGKISASVCLIFEREKQKIRFNVAKRSNSSTSLPMAKISSNSIGYFCEKDAAGGLYCFIPKDKSAELQAIGSLEKVVSFSNQRTKELGFKFNFTPLELYSLWVTEGAYFPLAKNQNVDDTGEGELHGYSDLGLDDFGNPNKTVRPYVRRWASDELLEFLKNKATFSMATNEQGENKYSVKNFDVINGLYAFVAMYAPAKAIAAANLYSIGIDINTLPREEQLAISYLYFNHGLNSKLLPNLRQSMSKAWTEIPTIKDKRFNPIRNALVRRAYYRYFEQQCEYNGLIDARLCIK